MPSVYNLGQVAIAAAVTDQVITEGAAAGGNSQSLIDRLDGMQAVTLDVAFAYGSGGTALVVVIETRLGAGGGWIEIARFDFATATARKVATLNALAAKAVSAVAALGAEGVFDGVLGDALRARVTSTGTYAGSTLSVRAAVR